MRIVNHASAALGALLRGEVKGWCFYLFWSWRSEPVRTSSLSEPLTSNTCKSRGFRQININNNLHVSSITSVSATVVWGVTKPRGWPGQNMWPLTSEPPALWALFDLWSSCSTVQKQTSVMALTSFPVFYRIFFSCQDSNLWSLHLWSQQHNAAWRNFLLWLEWISFSSRKNAKCSVFSEPNSSWSLLTRS